MDRRQIEDQIKQLEKLDVFKKDSFYRDILDTIIESSRKRPFKIAVVGEFSTGKSTFINALLGRDLLSHATEEVTAALTNIYNVGRNSERYRTCDVTFHDGSKVHLEKDDELAEYTTTQSVERNVIQDIRCVDYYTDYMPEDTDLVIVDTPGLNGMADGHRKLTLEEVKNADFCIYLFGIRGMADTDTLILKQLLHYQNHFAFVLNFIDQLRASEGETAEERIKELDHFLGEILSNEKVSYRIFAVSALKALAAKDRSIKRLYQDDTLEIEEESRTELYRQSGFEELEQYIRQEINSSTIEQISVRRMAYMLSDLLKSVEEDLASSQEQAEYLRSEEMKSGGVGRLEEKLQYFTEISKKNREKVIIYAKSECINIEKEFKEYVKKELNKLIAKYEKILQDYDQYSDLEQYVEYSLNKDVKEDADNIYDYVEENISNCLHGIMNNVILRIQEYFKETKPNKDIGQITFHIKKMVSRQDAQIISMEEALKETDKNVEYAQKKLSTMCTEILEKETALSSDQELLRANILNLQRKEEEQKKRIANLGRQPEVKVWYEDRTEYYTSYEYRGGFGILDSLFGPKEVRRSRTVSHKCTDDSDRRRWVAKRDDVLRSTQGDINRYKSLIDSDKERIRNSERVLRKKKGDSDAVEKDLAYYQDKLKHDTALLNDLKEKANRELLDVLRNSIQDQLFAYLDPAHGEVAEIIKGYVQDTVSVHKETIIQKAGQFYDEKFKNLRNIYQSNIEGKKQDAFSRFGDYTEQILKIKKIREELGDASE